MLRLTRSRKPGLSSRRPRQRRCSRSTTHSDDPTISRSAARFRSRGEGLVNQFRPAPAARNDYLASFLTNIFAEYNLGTGEDRRGAVRQPRLLAEPRNSSASTTEVNALELGQAYLNFDLSDAGQDGSKSSLTAGRFTKDIGSRRLVARNDFRNTINAFTGPSFDWKGANKDQMTLLWTMPQTRLPSDMRGIRNNTIEFDRESPDLQLFGGSYTFAKVFGGSLEVYGYGLYEQDTGTGLRVGADPEPSPVHPRRPAVRGRRSPGSGTTISRRSTRRVSPGRRPPSPTRATSGLGLLLPWRGGLHLRCALAAAGRAAIRSRQRRQQQP